MPTCEGCGFSSRASTPHVLTEPHDDRQGAFHLPPCPRLPSPSPGWTEYFPRVEEGSTAGEQDKLGRKKLTAQDRSRASSETTPEGWGGEARGRDSLTPSQVAPGHKGASGPAAWQHQGQGRNPAPTEGPTCSLLTMRGRSEPSPVSPPRLGNIRLPSCTFGVTCSGPGWTDSRVRCSVDRTLRRAALQTLTQRTQGRPGRYRQLLSPDAATPNSGVPTLCLSLGGDPKFSMVNAPGGRAMPGSWLSTGTLSPNLTSNLKLD